MFFISFILVDTTDAHSVLEKATPEDGAQLKEAIKSIELSFNTKIENGSTLYLVNANDEKIEPASITSTDNILEATFSRNLSPGSYQVNWKVLGADGHIIENQYSFTIKDQEESVSSKSEKKQQNATTAEPKKETVTSQDGSDTDNQNAKGKTNRDSESSFVFGIISLLIIAGIILLAWMWFSRSKNKG
ncbi:copper resistance CopC family protein [Virgibacillus necropolis]|uniref:copper resistance CopC family protein n=1 Tax=Virgibacillus necropolis TaxID=163877 RepID=UPI0013747AC6|nr:copper resistance CopC family protein [Virgibacillus necropolis]